MKLSKHAIKRAQQRGISSQQVKLIMAFGQIRRVPGEAISYQFTKKSLMELEVVLKQGVQLLDKLKNKTIICNPTDDTVITCYHQV